MIKAIIFDCWQTLFYNNSKTNPLADFAERIGKSISDYEYIKRFEASFMLDRYENVEERIKQFVVKQGIEPSDELIKELAEILDRAGKNIAAYPEAIHVLKELKARFKVGMISNTNYASFRRLAGKFDLKELFDEVLTSFETKLFKPDPRLFKLMLDRLGVSKNEIVMVGDSLMDDVLAAEKFGIKAVLIDRNNKHLDYKNRITSLNELNMFLK